MKRKQYLKYLPIFERMTQVSKKEREKILKNLNSEALEILSNTILKILKGRVPLSKAHYRKLSPYKRVLLDFAKRSKDTKYTRYKFLKKKGCAILPLLLPPLISILTSILNG